MKYYVDTSFIASLYIESDRNHAVAAEVLNGWTTPPHLQFTALTMLEFHGVLARFEHKGKMRAGEARTYLSLIKQDIEAGVLESCPIHAHTWLDETFKVVEQITPLTGTRTLDAMHIALARLNGAKTILSFDKNQRLAAKAAGFALLPA